MIDTGIYRRLMAEKVGREKLSRENTFQKPVNKNENLRLEGVSSLEGGLVTLFILCGAGISLAGITFCFECRRILLERLIKGYKNILKVLKMLRQNLIKFCKRVSNGLKMLTGNRKFLKFRRHQKIHVETIVINVKPK